MYTQIPVSDNVSVFQHFMYPFLQLLIRNGNLLITAKPVIVV